MAHCSALFSNFAVKARSGGRHASTSKNEPEADRGVNHCYRPSLFGGRYFRPDGYDDHGETAAGRGGFLEAAMSWFWWSVFVLVVLGAVATHALWETAGDIDEIVGRFHEETDKDSML